MPKAQVFTGISDIPLQRHPQGNPPSSRRPPAPAKRVGDNAPARTLPDFEARFARDLWEPHAKKADKAGALKLAGGLPVKDFNAACLAILSWFPVWNAKRALGEHEAQYIPCLTTWLKGRRWEESTPPMPQAAKTGPQVANRAGNSNGHGYANGYSNNYGGNYAPPPSGPRRIYREFPENYGR